MRMKSAAAANGVIRQRNVLQHNMVLLAFRVFLIDFYHWCVWSLAHIIATAENIIDIELGPSGALGIGFTKHLAW